MYEKHFEALRSDAAAKGVQAQFTIRVGHPADQIILAAEQEHADVIVMGSHGRTGLARAVLGSVAEEVMRGSTRPVFLLRAP
jgi:nucleotide-binding universal stress UspA family protein